MISWGRPKANWRSPGLPLLRHRPQIERCLSARKRPGGARGNGSLMPPRNILNAPTRLMKDIGYGKIIATTMMKRAAFRGRLLARGNGAASFYTPTDRGFEKTDRGADGWWEEQSRERQG